MKKPLFSVVITSHNRAELARRAIESVKAQNQVDVEILFITDEASPDTHAVGVTHLGENDLFLRRTGVSGPAKSRNLGLSLASGEYVLFLDDDDTQIPGLLDGLRNSGLLDGRSAIFFDYEEVVEDRSVFPPTTISRRIVNLVGKNPLDLAVFNFIPNNCVAFPRSVLSQSLFDERLRSHEDWDFLLSVLSTGGPFKHVPIRGARVHKGNNSDQRSSNPVRSGDWAADIFHIYRRWPAPSAEAREKRRAILGGRGLEVNVTWL